MNSNTKFTLISLLLFISIFLITFFIVREVFGLTTGSLVGSISAVVAVILAPRQTIVNKQSGREVQLTWFFSKKVIRLK